jgi:hypothetical protein
MQKIGNAAYKLQLPDGVDIHPVFHVSQLKQHVGPKAMPQANLPLVTPDGYLKLQPITILDTRALPRKDEVVMQWLIQWQPPKQATWEDKLFIKGTFPDFYNHTLKAWWHDGASHGQEAAQRGGSCPTPANLGLPQVNPVG